MRRRQSASRTHSFRSTRRMRSPASTSCVSASLQATPAARWPCTSSCGRVWSRNTTSSRRRRRKSWLSRSGTEPIGLPSLIWRHARPSTHCEHRRHRFGRSSGGEARNRLGNEIGIRCATRRVWSHAPGVRFGKCRGWRPRSHPRGAAISCSASGRFNPSWRSRQTTNRPAAATMTAPTATSAAGTSPKNR